MILSMLFAASSAILSGASALRASFVPSMIVIRVASAGSFSASPAAL